MFSEAFKELIDLSMQNKKGLTFFINGQTISGHVVKVTDNGGCVEARNQTFSRIIIRLEEVDALAVH